MVNRLGERNALVGGINECWLCVCLFMAVVGPARIGKHLFHDSLHYFFGFASLCRPGVTRAFLTKFCLMLLYAVSCWSLDLCLLQVTASMLRSAAYLARSSAAASVSIIAMDSDLFQLDPSRFPQRIDLE